MTNHFTGAEALAQYLTTLRQKREHGKNAEKRFFRKRLSLTQKDRAAILRKTNHRCHICGGVINGGWQADHVLAHSRGGIHSVDNYLAAHATCNNYRWDYLAEEFELILKIGVWARTQIEKRTPLGLSIAGDFTAKERVRLRRRRSTPIVGTKAQDGGDS